jgi:hypothetical protein
MMIVSSTPASAPWRADERLSGQVATSHPGPQPDTVSLSSLGRSVSTAISRAEAATEGKSTGELRAIVKRAETHLNDDWRRDAATFAKETPKGADEGRVAISRQATSYIKQLTTLPRPAGIARENPFFGLSRTELSAIQYDESGSFTTNDRRAAVSEVGRQYGEWSAAVCARAMKEHALTGKTTDFLKEVLAYFDALPAIDRAALPKGYMERLRMEVHASEKDDVDALADPLSMVLPCRWQGDSATAHSPQEEISWLNVTS